MKRILGTVAYIWQQTNLLNPLHFQRPIILKKKRQQSVIPVATKAVSWGKYLFEVDMHQLVTGFSAN